MQMVKGNVLHWICGSSMMAILCKYLFSRQTQCKLEYLYISHFHPESPFVIRYILNWSHPVFYKMNSTNITDFDYAQCTYATCDVTQIGQVEYIPSLAGNAFYLAVFAAVLVCQLGFAIRYHTWGYFIGMFCGLALEIIGYAARILLHYDAFDNNDFIIYLVGLTLGPAFFSASIYLCLGRIIAIYGRNLLVLSSRTITIAFCCFDLVSLILQACGGALVSLAINDTLTNAGLQIMIAGLSTQVASTTLFSCVCLLLILAIRRNPDKVNPNTAALRYSPKFRFFLFGK